MSGSQLSTWNDSTQSCAGFVFLVTLRCLLARPPRHLCRGGAQAPLNGGFSLRRRRAGCRSVVQGADTNEPADARGMAN